MQNGTCKIVLFLIIIMFSLSCAYVQKKIDVSGLNDLAEDILTDFQPGSPMEIEKFIKSFSIEKDTSPRHLNLIKIQGLDRWQMDHPHGEKLIMEKISFPSEIRHGKKIDKAVFYSYRTGDWNGSRTILWVPGLAVSDFAFRFIKKLFREKLKKGYNIVFFVIPYHLDRTETGKENGQGFFNAEPVRNVNILLESVREIRTMHAYLKKRGVKEIGAWGGSIGASMVLLADQVIQFSHICLMIPILNFETVTVKNVHMIETINRYRETGFSKDMLCKAYCAISPINYPLRVSPERFHIMYADYDQLTPAETVKSYAEKNGITNIKSYKRSHATILLTKELYTDCGNFLDLFDM